MESLQINCTTTYYASILLLFQKAVLRVHSLCSDTCFEVENLLLRAVGIPRWNNVLHTYKKSQSVKMESIKEIKGKHRL